MWKNQKNRTPQDFFYKNAVIFYSTDASLSKKPLKLKVWQLGKAKMSTFAKFTYYPEMEKPQNFHP